VIPRHTQVWLTQQARCEFDQSGDGLVVCLETASGSEIRVRIDAEHIRRHGELIGPSAAPFSLTDAPAASEAIH